MANIVPHTPLPKELRERLRRVIPLLSSSQDGEALAAVRTISRLLTKHRVDWNDLAAQVAADPATVAAPTVSTGRWGGIGAELPSEHVGEVVSAVRAHHGQLSDRAQDFLTDLEARSMLFASVHLSPKQHEWLLGLAEAAAARVPS